MVAIYVVNRALIAMYVTLYCAVSYDLYFTECTKILLVKYKSFSQGRIPSSLYFFYLNLCETHIVMTVTLLVILLRINNLKLQLL
jgi:hypothetical protein